MSSVRRHTRFITLDDTRHLAIDEWPRPSTPVVLLLHGNGMARGLWRPIAEAIAGDCHVVAIDHRGHGASWKPAPPEAYEWARIADETAEAVRHEGWSPLVLCGHSLGANIAVDIAARYPDLVDALVLLEPALAYEPLNAESQAVIDQIAERRARRRAEWDTLQAAAEHARTRFPGNVWLPEAFDGFMETAMQSHNGAVRLACAPAVEAAVCVGGDSFTPFHQLPQIRRPTWIAQSATADDGTERRPGDPVDQILGARRTISQTTGHFLPFERFDIPVRLLREAILSATT